MEPVFVKTEIFCFTCLAEDYVEPLKKRKLIQVLEECASVEINTIGEIGLYICNLCYDLLNKFYLFKKRFNEVQNLIKNNLVHVLKNDENESQNKNLNKENTQFSDSNIIDTKNENKENSSEQDVNYDSQEDTNCENKNIFLFSTKCTKIEVTSEENDSLLNCNQCAKVFAKRCDLNRHLERHKGNKKHKCTECDEKFYELHFLIKHIKIKHTNLEPSKKCESCDEKFFFEKQLRLHYNREHERKSGECDICGKTKNDLIKHKRNAHGNKKVFSCLQCEKIFKSKQTLNKHIVRVHEGIVTKIPKTVCNICGKEFTNISTHVKSHFRDSRLSCRFCKRPFDNMTDLKKHSRTEHVIERQNEEHKFECRSCGKRFLNLANLHSHKRFFHNNTKLYECQICKKIFKKQYRLSEHMRIHTDERPFLCKVCGKTFRNSCTLNDHVRIHTGEKPYVCKLCNRAYPRSNALRTHMKTHTNNLLDNNTQFDDGNNQIKIEVNLNSKIN